MAWIRLIYLIYIVSAVQLADQPIKRRFIEFPHRYFVATTFRISLCTCACVRGVGNCFAVFLSPTAGGKSRENACALYMYTYHPLDVQPSPYSVYIRYAYKYIYTTAEPVTSPRVPLRMRIIDYYITRRIIQRGAKTF